MNQIEDIAQAIGHTRLLREKLLADPHRPGYHFAIPEDFGIPGDPNGAFYARGRYHLMYLYRCSADGFRWGHVSSRDLLHWRWHPDALMPDDLDGGIFSGGAFVDDDGTAYLTYWSLPLPGSPGGIRIAKSRDPLYEVWEKQPFYALPATQEGMISRERGDGSVEYIGCADPSNIWKQGGKYYMQTGNLPILLKFRKPGVTPPADVRGDWVDLFESEDLMHWTHKGRFYDWDESKNWTAADEDDMCPSFLPLPESPQGGQPGEKYLQLFIAHNRGCQYYIGDYDRQNYRFLPQRHGRMSWVDNTFFAPEALMAPDGRQIMWAWLTDDLEEDANRGWSGVYGLPRSLWRNGEGELGIAPIRELEALRYHQIQHGDVEMQGMHPLPVANGLSCEIELTVQPGSSRQGLVVRGQADGRGGVQIYYDAQAGQLVMDTSQATVLGRPAVEMAPLHLGEGEALKLRVFVDKSIIEVFANDRQAICRRVYPPDDRASVFLHAQGEGGRFSSVTSWEMMPCNMY